MSSKDHSSEKRKKHLSAADKSLLAGKTSQAAAEDITVTGHPPPSPPPLPPAPPPPPEGGSSPPPPPPPPPSCSNPGNRVNNKFVYDREGGVTKTADVPGDNSGVTIGAGVDLSKHSIGEISSWSGVSSETISAISPYVNSSLVGSAANSALEANGGLSLSADQAQALTDGAMSAAYNGLANAFNSSAQSGYSTFQQLPAGTQTALFSVAYNVGLAALQKYDLWNQAISGDWDAAYNNLITWSGGGQSIDDRRKLEGEEMKSDLDSKQIPTPSNPC